MPIPFLLAGLAVGAGVLGAAGHSVAKDTNTEAENVVGRAKKLYDTEKEHLESLQAETETILTELGMQKKHVMETTVTQFLDVYDKIKNIELSDSTGLDEIANFAIDPQEALQLREISGVYVSAFAGGAAGAVAGTAIALAVSGSMPLVTGALSLAGTALTLGEVGLAGGIAGTALLSGISMTPIAAIVGPAMLISGFSASMKADENLEKANVMLAEAEAAVEKMKVAGTLCQGIADRAKMFGNLLAELNEMFQECTDMLHGIVYSKVGTSQTKIDIRELTKEERDLIAVTRSLAGSVKRIIDIPILNKEGTLSEDANRQYNKISGCLPVFHENMEKTCQYREETIEWYKEAAGQGNVYAQIKLADCYCYGEGKFETKK